MKFPRAKLSFYPTTMFLLKAVTMTAYVTNIPAKFILESGREVTLTIEDIEEKLTRNMLFKLWVPDIEPIYKHLTKECGFTNAIPSIPKGEKYNLRKVLNNVWELHIRLYSDGFIDAEVEVRREFLEHLTPKRLNVVYEAFQFYRDVYDKLHIFYVPENEWIIEIKENFQVKLQEPNTLTPWKPIITGIIITGLLAYTLSKLTKGNKGWI